MISKHSETAIFTINININFIDANYTIQLTKIEVPNKTSMSILTVLIRKLKQICIPQFSSTVLPSLKYINVNNND